MTNTKTLRVLNKALIIAIAITIISFIIPIVPCQTAPVVAEPIYEWGLCRLPNPLGNPTLGISTEYYGSQTDSLAGFIMHFAIIFIITTIILFSLRSKAAKILDLTNKK